MLLVIVFESMIFVALLGAFVVQRSATRPWPPAGQPFLPIGVTWVNTFVLLGSLLPLQAAGRALRRGRHAAFVRSLAIATAMGAIFLVQGIEGRVSSRGLTFRERAEQLRRLPSLSSACTPRMSSRP
jgi:heme/copper-type cytochrome/quinol oxidase subunit 3